MILAITAIAPAAMAQAAPAVQSQHPSSLPPTPLKKRLMKLWRRMTTLTDGAAVVGPQVAKAIGAAERARRAKEAGDRLHSRQLAKLSGDWAGLADALIDAVQTERANRKLAKKLKSDEEKLERGASLLALLQARRGRLQAALRGPAKRLVPKPKETR
jgi:hypothetical protein